MTDGPKQCRDMTKEISLLYEVISRN